MRLLMVTPYLPDTKAGHGLGVYLGALVPELADAAGEPVTVIAGARLAELGGLCDAGESVRRIVVARPTLQETTGLARLKFRLAALARWSTSAVPFAAAKAWSAALARQVSRAVATERFDAVLIEHMFAAPAVELVRGRIPTVLTDHEAAQPVPGHMPTRWMNARDDRLWSQYFTRFYRAADRLQAVNENDAVLLTERFDRPVGVRPVTAPVPDSPSAEPGRAPRRALFLGDLRHPPNEQAVQQLLTEIWPAVRERAGREPRLVLAGRGTERFGGDGVDGLGFVEDLDALIAETRLLIAPIQSGGGSRVKVLTALAAGLPVVTTPLGAAGIHAPATCLAVAEGASLVDVVVEWLEDSDAAAAAGEAAHTWAREHVSPRAVARRQLDELRDWLEDR